MAHQTQPDDPVRPAWNRAAPPVTEGTPQRWQVPVEHDLSLDEAGLRRRIAQASPSNAALRSKCRPGRPPQSWFDEAEHPFRPGAE